MSWSVERNERVAAERAARDLRLRAQGFKLISVLAAWDSRTEERPITTWFGETESLVIADAPPDCLKYGVGCVLVGPASEVIEVPAGLSSRDIAVARNGVVITVFKGQRPQ